MKSLYPFSFILLAILVVGTVQAQVWNRNPDIGYIYPAGGQRGATFEILVGGQFIRATKEIRVSGNGVTAELVETYRPRRNLMKEQRDLLKDTLRKLREKRLAEAENTGEENDDETAATEPEADGAMVSMVSMEMQVEAGQKDDVKLPEHPLLRNLETKSLKQLQHIQNEFFDFSRILKKQPNSQLAEMALIKVTIAADAAPGNRELRLVTPFGITDPMCFQVGTLPEAQEQEPNDPKPFRKPIDLDAPLALPVVINGQIMPGDVDRIGFKAAKGQKLVIEAHARRLVPFLADAVPGWFQATISVYNETGKELAFADDYRFHPDPVLFFVPPADGIYELEVRDAIYRGREDFVYRISIGELPFITEIFPLGGRIGSKTVASIRGWNLKRNRLPLNTEPGVQTIRAASLQQDGDWTNSMPYTVGSLPECLEEEPNNRLKAPQDIQLPIVVNGRIARPGDVDLFRFAGRKDDAVVLEIVARRLHSPMDALIKLLDAKGKIIAWNDDYMQKKGHLHRDMGFLTHHADPYLIVTLPQDGKYYVQITDTASHGSTAHAYRLRISEPQPDFSLMVSPSKIATDAGRATPVTIHALRKDGFDGPIEIALVDAPDGFKLDGGIIPAGRDHVRMTLTPPPKMNATIMPLKIMGSTTVGGKRITSPVQPADDVMQAYLWRHLAPCDELLVNVRKARWNALPGITLPEGPVIVPAGGSATVCIKTERYIKGRKVDVELRDPANGISVGNVTCEPKSMTFDITADGETVEPGFADNLIVEVFMEYPPNPKQSKKAEKEGKDPPKPRRMSVGIFPAIPFKVAKK